MLDELRSHPASRPSLHGVSLPAVKNEALSLANRREICMGSTTTTPSRIFSRAVKRAFCDVNRELKMRRF